MDRTGSNRVRGWTSFVWLLAIVLFACGAQDGDRSPPSSVATDAGQPLTTAAPPKSAAPSPHRPSPAPERIHEQPSAPASPVAAPSSVHPAPAGYDHDHFRTLPLDIARGFIAFTVSFDGLDNGQSLGVPEWVAYELRATPPGIGQAPTRPSRWSTDRELHEARIAPDDDSYKGSNYSRGHMCMKSHAHRISDAADTETHTVLNACPQLQGMNNGVWKAIEDLTGDWANSWGKVWIVTGPVFLANKQRQWIGDAGEVPVAIPDAFFKVVTKERGNTCDILAFLVPMEGDGNHAKSSADVRPYLTSVDIIEALTGLDLLTSLDDPLEESLEKWIFTEMWSLSAGSPAPVTEAAPRAPPSPPVAQPVQVQQPAAAPTVDPLPGVVLRGGVRATAAEEQLAKKLKHAGWEYVMPRPKSAQASWGNRDGRTTWWSGHWKNASRGAYSASQPIEGDKFKGDGVEATGWRRGGSPGAPSMVEWLCSKSGGIAPR